MAVDGRQPAVVRQADGRPRKRHRLIVTLLAAALNETVVPPAPSKLMESPFDPAENCTAPAALETCLKML